MEFDPSNKRLKNVFTKVSLDIGDEMGASRTAGGPRVARRKLGCKEATE